MAPDTFRFRIPDTVFGSDGKKELERLLAEKDEPEPVKAVPTSTVRITGSGYSILGAGTYGAALAALQEEHKQGKLGSQPTFRLRSGRVVARPFTFEETVRARVEDYNRLKDSNGKVRTDEERRALFDDWLDTSTGIAYKAGTTRFKLLPPIEELVGLAAGFIGKYAPIDYDSLKGVELDRSHGKYNCMLTKQEVLSHPAWNAAVQDKALLKDYADLIFKLKNDPGTAMDFYIKMKPATDELRALALGSVDDGSNAGGDGSLNYDTRFVRVDP